MNGLVWVLQVGRNFSSVILSVNIKHNFMYVKRKEHIQNQNKKGTCNGQIFQSLVGTL